MTSCSSKPEDIIQPSPPVTEEITAIPTEKEVEDDVFEVKDIDVAEYFSGTEGAAIFYEPSKGEYIYNQEMLDMYFSPYSTFKIFSTLIGLHEEIVLTEDSKMSYNGTIYWNDNWNSDLTLKESFRFSCVWYYHQMLYTLQPSEIEFHLNTVEYGNRDISEWNGNGSNSVPELNGFWLNSSLQITPRQQVYLLEKLFEEETIYQENHLNLVKSFMETEISHIFAKTGAGNKQSWYVGFFEDGADIIYFAVFVISEEKPTKNAKEVAVSIINDWEILK